MPKSRITIHEYEPLMVDPATGADIREAIAKVERSLRPRLPMLSEVGERLVIGNLVGGIRLRSGPTLDILPKVPTGENWTSAVLDLLQPHSRIEVQGVRDAGFTPDRPHLQEAIAIEFANRLEFALSREGPIQLLQQRHEIRRSPVGKLDVAKWLRGASLNPTAFPVSYNAFSTYNQFTEAIAYTANILALGSRDARLSSKLNRLSDLVLPGEATPSRVAPAILNQSLPQQWRQYDRVWSLVLAVLRNRTLLNSLGRLHGLVVAVEPWPLLETLLSRVIVAIANRLSNQTLRYDPAPKKKYPVLLPNTPGFAMPKHVEPDGVLLCNGTAFATFEAKYAIFQESPKEVHIYQALTAAAVLGAQISVLVYPEAFDPISFRVQGFSGGPQTLIAFGLDMYSYRRHHGAEDSLAQVVIDAIQQSATMLQLG